MRVALLVGLLATAGFAVATPLAFLVERQRRLDAEEQLAKLRSTALLCDDQLVQCRAFQGRIALVLELIWQRMEN